MADSVENILIGLVRDSNNHIDKINNSVLSNNKLLQTLIAKVTKVQEENAYLREKVNVVINSSVSSNTLLHEKIDTLVNMNKRLEERIEFLEPSSVWEKNFMSNTIPGSPQKPDEEPKKPKKTKKLKEPKKPKEPKEPKIQCSAMTAKGSKCTKPCVPGEEYCTLHMKMRNKSPVEPKKKRPVIKKKKEIPMHNHKPGELPTEMCELCETHGDIFDPDMPNNEFEESQDNDTSIEDKLRKLLEEEKLEKEYQDE
tara:strand:+ start:3314 stop:4075 length:762 start_codon:yes stop_codon:yes gene_type:complete